MLLTGLAWVVCGVYFIVAGYALWLVFDGVARLIRRHLDHKRRFPTARIARRK